MHNKGSDQKMKVSYQMLSFFMLLTCHKHTTQLASTVLLKECKDTICSSKLAAILKALSGVNTGRLLLQTVLN